MPRRDVRKVRSRAEWYGRIALACGIVLLGIQSVIFSVAQVWVGTKPAEANAIVSYDGRISAAHAATLFTPTTSGSEHIQIDALARKALSQDPTAVLAVTTLGLDAAAHGDAVTARHLLAYAQTLSRRNVQTQMWSIEDAVGRGDVRTALRWYDVALRTKPSMREVLYPILTQAARDPAIRSELAQTLVRKPAWADTFINYAATQGQDPQSIGTLFLALRHQGTDVPESAWSSIINALLNAGYIANAWNYYGTIRPGADRLHARDPQFSAILEAPSLFDWIVMNDGGVDASIQRGHQNGEFEFSAPASIGGPLLKQVQLLSPGTYRLLGHSTGIEQDARAFPYWALTCRNDGRELGRVAVPNSTQANGIFSGDFSVPADCPVQVLTLIALPSDSVSGVSGQLDRVELSTIR